MTPDGWATAIGRSPAVDSLFGIEPSIRQAIARQTAPVAGTARCGWPIEIIRIMRDISAEPICRPERVSVVRGAATIATFGTLGIVRAEERSDAIPIATEAAQRMSSIRARKAASAS